MLFAWIIVSVTLSMFFVEAASVFGDANMAVAAEGADSARPILVAFDIPAQSLASALEAYGAATGIELFYDAALAAGKRSPGVRGSLSPARALEIILRDTGYIQQSTGLDMISIVRDPQETVRGVASKRTFDRYGAYFSNLETRVSRTLCRDDRAEIGSGEIVFRFWLSTAGAITRADIVASGGDPERDKAITRQIEGLDVGEPPPAGLPEPVVMAVFPPARGEMPGCADTGNGVGH